VRRTPLYSSPPPAVAATRRRPIQTCVLCGAHFRPKRRHVVCCTRECGWKFVRCRTADRRAAQAEAIREAKKRARQRICVHCDKNFEGDPRQKYCSKVCQNHASYARAREAAKTRPENKRVCAHCRVVFFVAFSLGRNGGSKRRHFCSKPCRLSAEREGKFHGESHRQRAIRLGLPYERVFRQKVFKRDGWRCQLCHRSTPKRLLRDHQHLSAPTLDHIVPMSMGGGHTWDNLQCLCRACNSKKSASIAGQLRLKLESSAVGG
jgi:HNH endonuclease